MTVVPDEMHFRTLNLQMNFVRIGRTQPLNIDAKVVAHTRQMITVRAEFRREDGELLAEATRPAAPDAPRPLARRKAGRGSLAAHPR